MIYFHADDYGITKKQDEIILDCAKNGALNSISVLPNSKHLDDALEVLKAYDPENKIRRVLHLNFVEGYPCADPKDIPLLVGKNGKFNKSFIDIWKWNLLFQGEKRIELKEQFKTEIKAQFTAVTGDNNFKITAIDSHQHYHMIPVVFDAMMEVILEDYKHQIKQVRVPVDPLSPLFTTPTVWKDFKGINFVKYMILKPFAKRNEVILERCGFNVPLFFGIFFTCEMKKKVVTKLLSKYEKIAKRKNINLELMFHPGNLEEVEDLLEPTAKDLEEFYFSDNRRAEAECLKTIQKL